MAALLEIRELTVDFTSDEGPLRAVDGVTFDIHPGEIFGLVGESGCGKTVTALSILRLIPSPAGRFVSGRIVFQGRNLLELPIPEMRAIRGRSISMIFQEPMTALSPLHRVGWQLVEAIRLHQSVPRRQAWQRSAEWLRRVGLPDPERAMLAYPFQLSGGMRQRVMIAMAMLLDPALIIADEPTTAVDVTIQAQIFELMRAVRRPEAALLLITHDLGVVWEMCSRMAVMYAGEIVEIGAVPQVFSRPLHPYTEALLQAIPSLDAPQPRLRPVAGSPPSPRCFPPGCRFHDRCRYAFERCRREHPPLSAVQERQARCFLAEERAKTSHEKP